MAADATDGKDNKSIANDAIGENKTAADDDLVDTDDDNEEKKEINNDKTEDKVDDEDDQNKENEQNTTNNETCAEASQPQTVCMKRKSLSRTDEQAQAKSLAGAT